MTDEHLMRLWADAHNGFSADFDRGIVKLDRFLRGHKESSTSIETAYTPGSCAAPADNTAGATPSAALAGVTACLATMGLLLTVALLATADVHPAHAYPLIAHTIVA